MKRYTVFQDEIIETVELLMCAYTRYIVVWFTAEDRRCKRIEYNLPKIVQKGGLRVFQDGQKHVYTLSSNRTQNTAKMEHGLVCAECLIRFKLAKEGEFISEMFFRQKGFCPIPEWAVIYGNTLLLFEYSTADNFRRTKLMKAKVHQYQNNFRRFEEHFGAMTLALFVFNAPRYKVWNFAKEQGVEASYFVDLATFMSIEAGAQLTAPIYFWGGDGQSYPLG